MADADASLSTGHAVTARPAAGLRRRLLIRAAALGAAAAAIPLRAAISGF
jgi:hypothetical protein